MDNCTCCYTDTLGKCETEIKLNIVLPVYGAYRWVITDKNGNKYQGDLSPDQTIPVEDLPPGMLTAFGNNYQLQIFEDGVADCGPVKFYVAGKYDCIDFTMMQGTFEKNNLGCEVVADTSTPGLPFQLYVASLTQTGTNDPVETESYNTIGGIVWTRAGVGDFNGTSVGSFPLGRTFLSISGAQQLTRVSDDVINIFTGSDGTMVNRIVKVEVYPI